MEKLNQTCRGDGADVKSVSVCRLELGNRISNLIYFSFSFTKEIAEARWMAHSSSNGETAYSRMDNTVEVAVLISGKDRVGNCRDFLEGSTW